MTTGQTEKVDLATLYNEELIRNMIHAYKNMESMGMLTPRQLKKYHKMLKEFQKERKERDLKG